MEGKKKKSRSLFDFGFKKAKLDGILWCKVHRLWSSDAVFFPTLCYIAEVAASLPVTNAWPERGASALKNLKTKHRNRMNNDMLNTLLQVCINGPEVADAGQVVKEAVSLWMGAKKRKELSKRKKSLGLSSVPPPHSVEVQTDPIVVVDQEALREEVYAAVKAFHLEEDPEHLQSDSEFEEEFEKCFEANH